MYAPSSYNDTMTGETLSSVSEKSETYSNEGSNNEYVVSFTSSFPVIIFTYVKRYMGQRCIKRCLSYLKINK